ncbi:MAG: hypothetical protein R3E98_12950 [Gemmatimonadota bacterium]
MARAKPNPFAPEAILELLDAHGPPTLAEPVRAGRPRLLIGCSRLGEEAAARRWAGSRGDGRGRVVPAATATVLVDLAAHLGSPEPDLRGAPVDVQTDHLRRALRDAGRNGCERVAFLGLRHGGVLEPLVGLLDRSVLLVLATCVEPVDGVAPRHWERVRVLPPPDELLTEWLEARFAEQETPLKSGVCARICAHAGPRSEDVLTLAGEVYRIGAGKKRIKSAHVDRALDRLVGRTAHLVLRVWETLSPLQQNLLRALAAGEQQLFAARSRARFGLRSTASVARTLELLTEKGLVERSPRDGSYAFESPWVRRWVQREALPDVGIGIAID